MGFLNLNSLVLLLYRSKHIFYSFAYENVNTSASLSICSRLMRKVYLNVLKMVGLGTKSPRNFTRNFPNAFGQTLSDIMCIVYVCEQKDFPYRFHLVPFTVSPPKIHIMFS